MAYVRTFVASAIFLSGALALSAAPAAPGDESAKAAAQTCEGATRKINTTSTTVSEIDQRPAAAAPAAGEAAAAPAAGAARVEGACHAINTKGTGAAGRTAPPAAAVFPACPAGSERTAGLVTGTAAGGPVTVTPGKIATGVATGTDTLRASSSGTAAGIAIDEEGGPNQHADRPKKPKGAAMTAPGTGTASATAEARHAINSKGTGTSGRGEPLCQPDQGAIKKSKSNISTN
jgi:hypothetical protein